MNWDAIGALAELIGSVAVVITLVFLIFEIRHNATITKKSTLKNALNANTGKLGNLISDPELSDIFYRGIRSDDDLNVQQRGRFDIFSLFFRMLDAQSMQYREGTADQEHWESLVRNLEAALHMPGSSASWQRQKN